MRWWAGLAGAAAVVCSGSAPPGVRPATFHFAYDVLPLLQRQGCSAAQCHGGATGRGGFKLSLFATDPAADHAAIALDGAGRRIDLIEPERSLILQKPSRALEHGGGLRLPRHGSGYARLRAWIADGAPFTRGGPPRATALELDVDQDRVRAVARFADGTSRDVSELTTFTTTDERVVAVTAAGELRANGPGEAYVLGRFAHLNGRHPIIRPFGAVATAPWTMPASGVDRVWLAELAELGLVPGMEADVDRLARRLYLDLAGRPPTLHELHRYRGLPEATRVATTVDELLAHDEFTDVFGAHLADLLEVEAIDGEAPRDRQRNAQFRDELTAAVRDGTPLDVLTDRILSGRHGLVQRFADPRDRAEFVGRAFLGVRLGCARCHDHPLDRWRQREHLAFSALFTDPRPAPEGGMMAGSLFSPDSGDAVEPRLLPILDREPPKDIAPGARVSELVRAIEHRMLARNLANRVFAILIGRGLVEPVDDHRLSNPPIHGRLLAELADELVASGYDLRAMVRTIARSRLYATSTEPAVRDDDGLARYLGRRTARPLSARLLLRCVDNALGVPQSATTSIPTSPLAWQLSLRNGSTLHRALTSQGGTTIDALLDLVDDDERRLVELFETVLTRRPTTAERERFLPTLTHAADPRTALRTMALAMFQSREFGSHR